MTRQFECESTTAHGRSEEMNKISGRKGKHLADPFFEFYDREEVAYGEQPSPPVRAFLEQASEPGPALDLGAGAGRDSLALAAAGYQVTAVDLSDRGPCRFHAGIAEKVP